MSDQESGEFPVDGSPAQAAELVVQDQGNAGLIQQPARAAQAADLGVQGYGNPGLIQLPARAAQAADLGVQGYGNPGLIQLPARAAQAADLGVQGYGNPGILRRRLTRTAQAAALGVQDRGNAGPYRRPARTARAAQQSIRDHLNAGILRRRLTRTAQAAALGVQDRGNAGPYRRPARTAQAAQQSIRDHLNDLATERAKLLRRQENENQRRVAPSPFSQLQWTPYSWEKYGALEVVTQASTISYPTPTYTAPPRPTPTYLTLPYPVLAYPPPFIQTPASSQLAQPEDFSHVSNPYFPPHPPPQVRHHFTTSLLSTPDTLPKLIPLVRPNTSPLDINQTNSTKSQPTNSPTYSTFLIDRLLEHSAPVKPLPPLIPITVPITMVHSASTESRTPIRSSPVHTFASTSSSAVDFEFSNLLQIENTEITTTTNQNVASIDSSVHSLNPTTQPRLSGHWSHVLPELNEHLQYQLWPGADMFNLDSTEEVPPPLDQNSEFDQWLLGLRSPDSTVVPGALQAPASFPTSSPDATVPLPPSAPATSSVTTPSPEDAKSKEK